MPMYTFKNTENGEVHDKMMKIADLDGYLRDNPSLQVIIRPVNFIYDAGTNIKVDDGFRDRMKEIKKTYKINNIPDY